MRRKFIYFKLANHSDPRDSAEILSALEIENLVGEISPVDNVFQLILQPEVRRIIEKDLKLQKELSFNLPDFGRHGYIWVGVELPDLKNAIQRLTYTEEIFLFQQLLEPEPEFLKSEFRQIPFIEFNISLWRVYKFWTFSFFFDKVSEIGWQSESAQEIEEKFKLLKDSLISQSGNGKHIIPNQLKSKKLKNSFLSVKESIDQTEKWTSALANILQDGKDQYRLYIPFSPSQLYLIPLNLKGISLHIETLNPINHIYLNAAKAFEHLDAHTFNTMAMELHTKLNNLLDTNNINQTDLFMHSAESAFINFWNEKKELLSKHYPDADQKGLRQLAAHEFLITSNTLSRETFINQVLMSLLIDAFIKYSSEETEKLFSEFFVEQLKNLYLKLVLYAKLKILLPVKLGAFKADLTDSLDSKSSNNSADAGLVFLPARINQQGFEDHRFFIDFLQLVKNPAQLEKQQLGNKTLKTAFKNQITKEMENNEGFYAIVSKEGKDWLDRLELMSHRDDSYKYYALWKQYYTFIQKLSKMENLQKFALLIENIKVIYDKNNYDVPNVSVIKHVFENDPKLPFMLADEINIKASKNYTALIYQKRLEEE